MRWNSGQLITQHGGLYEVPRTPAHELMAGLPGMGPAKAARVAAAFQLGRRAAPGEVQSRQYVRGSADLARIAAPLLRGLRRERVVVVVCDAAGAVLRKATPTEGAVDRSLLPVRDVQALAIGGRALGVAHNHPTGRVEPSKPDRRATTRLAAGTEAVGLRFLDHVVVTDRGWRRVEVTSG